MSPRQRPPRASGPQRKSRCRAVDRTTQHRELSAARYTGSATFGGVMGRAGGVGGCAASPESSLIP